MPTLNTAIRDWLATDNPRFVPPAELPERTMLTDLFRDGLSASWGPRGESTVFSQQPDSTDSMWVYPTLYAHIGQDAAEGTSISPDDFDRLRDRMREMNSGTVHGVQQNQLSRDSVFSRLLDNSNRRQNWFAYGSGDGTAESASAGPDSLSFRDHAGREVGRIENLQPFGCDAPPPAHHRSSPGHCACGFASMFTGDMARHIQNRLEAPGTPVDQSDGVPRKWWNCDRCQLYKPCREWRVAVYNYRTNFADVNALLPPNGPEVITEYRCDECVDGTTNTALP